MWTRQVDDDDHWPVGALTMAKRDFYETLGVSKTATEAELKSAFRKAAMQCHPDRHPGDKQAEARFKELNEAYQHLSDAQKRAAYDRYGHAAFEQAGMSDGFAASMSDIFDDLFGDMMGGRRGRQPSGRERGADLRYNLEITPRRGVPRQDSDDQAADLGRPAKPARDQARAPVRSRRPARPAPVTDGCGPSRDSSLSSGPARPAMAADRRSTIPCDKCAGAGRVTRERTLSVNVPAGVEDGTRIRLSGEGEAGMRGGPTGDLYIFLSLKPHPIFQRDGADLYCRVPISMVQAALGGEFTVRTLDGTESKVSIPEGAQSGRQLRLRGKGMPILRSREAGDLFVQLNVETPQNLTRRQRELLLEFASESSHKTHPESAGFFSKMKEFFEGLG